MNRKFSDILAISLLVVLLESCGSGMMMGPVMPPPVVQDPEFVFVANTNSNTVTAFEIDSSGTLFSVGTFAAGAAPEFMATDAAGKFLFVGNTASNNVSAFQIDKATGKLTPVAGSPFATGTQPEGMALVSGANLLFVANNIGNSISAFHIDHMSNAVSPFSVDPIRGSLSPVTPLPALSQNCSSTCHTNPLRVVIHPTARLAFVAD